MSRQRNESIAARGERSAGRPYPRALVSDVGPRVLRSERLRRLAVRAPWATVPLRWLWARVGLAQWEYVPEGWARAGGGSVRGWQVPEVAAAYEAHWEEFRRLLTAPRPLGVIHEAVIGARLVDDDLHAHNAAVSFGYVLARAARQRESISILDWGGALGHHYVLGTELLPGIELDYTCKEVAAVCDRGRALLPEVRFVSDDSYADRSYDLVLASSSLQYQQDWRRALADWQHAARGFVFVTRLPVTLKGGSFVVLQRAYAYGYDTEFLGWVLNRDEFVAAAAEAGLALVREFVLGDAQYIRRAPAPVEVRGYLFRPRPGLAA